MSSAQGGPAAIQDVVRESGLSVGAIYTWFRGKDELILAGCDLITDQEMGELATRLDGVEGFRERLAAARPHFEATEIGHDGMRIELE